MIKEISMSTNEVVGDSKNYFCRDQYWQLLNNFYGKQVFKSIKGATLRQCNRDNCKGAHAENEIQTLPSNFGFKTLDKSKINLVAIYDNIINSFETLGSQVKDPEYIDRLSNFKSLNLIELLNLWFDITCFHRKLKKNIINGSDSSEVYDSINDIPEFFLENENIVWPLERVTKMCPKHMSLISKINRGEKGVIWDICIGSVNCKTGCHQVNDMICHKDFLFGECDCMSNQEMELKKSQIQEKINNLREILKSPTDKNGFTTKKNNRKQKQYSDKIVQLQSEYRRLNRQVHLTEDGLIPFNVQLKIREEKLEAIRKEEEDKKKLQESKKEERMDLLKNSKVKKILKKPKF